ncbi:MAG: flagellar basal body P-ring formation protein FlgA [Betaproteobacteria bacterium]|nr:flagellar basal body P-ring formation protein FlgA [Betaproteobacteria bacterium]
MRCAAHLILIASLCAATPASFAAEPELRPLIEGFLKRETQNFTDPVSIEIRDAALPRQARDCPRPEAFFPAGRRAWGATVVGVRCEEPRWTIYVPVRVRVQGEYLTAARPLAAGTVLSPADWKMQHGDVASQPPGVLRTPEQTSGQTLRLPVLSGAALRTDQLLVATAVQRGQKVRVVYRGDGFEAVNEGTALLAAAEGQVVQVRLSDGRIIEGLARKDGVVEVVR